MQLMEMMSHPIQHLTHTTNDGMTQQTHPSFCLRGERPNLPQVALLASKPESRKMSSHSDGSMIAEPAVLLCDCFLPFEFHHHLNLTKTRGFTCEMQSSLRVSPVQQKSTEKDHFSKSDPNDVLYINKYTKSPTGTMF